MVILQYVLVSSVRYPPTIHNLREQMNWKRHQKGVKQNEIQPRYDLLDNISGFINTPNIPKTGGSNQVVYIEMGCARLLTKRVLSSR